MNSKWIKDLNIKPEAIQIWEENIGSMLFDISLRNTPLEYVSSGKSKKGKRNQWPYTNLKTFWTAK